MAEKISQINRNRRALILLILVAPAFYFFAVRGMRFFAVPSHSMVPTLAVGDWLVTLKQPEYHRGDIVVLKDSKTPDYLVKRIVGVAGDTLNVSTGTLSIDGEFASEPYIQEPMAYEFAHPVKLNENEIFVLGDNRNWSDDSHVDLQPTPVSALVGKVVFRYYPFHRQGPVPSYPLRNLSGK